MTTAPPLPEALAERIAAAAVAEGLADAVYSSLRTPIGRLLVVQSDAGVCRIGFEEEDADAALAEIAARIGPRVVRSARETEPLRDALEAYFEGDAPLGGLPVDLRLVHAPFRREALDALRAVRHGETVTYAELAARAGRPRAVRAAATACARNPVPIVVPCHRVLPSGGGIGNYGGGRERKKVLLDLESALA